MLYFGARIFHFGGAVCLRVNLRIFGARIFDFGGWVGGFPSPLKNSMKTGL